MSQINRRIRQKKDTAANWTSSNPVILNGELIAVETSNGAIRLKVGDGVKTFNQLPFLDEVIYNTVDSKIATELSGYATLEQTKVFLVTFTTEVQDGHTVITVDKTIEEIRDTYEAGRMVLGFYVNEGYIFPLTQVISDGPYQGVIFLLYTSEGMTTFRGYVGTMDSWSMNVATGDGVTIRRWS